jgi:dethiobiotin synthase
MPRGLFVTSTGTEIGKTFVSRGLSLALTKRGLSVSAIKPIETGCDPYPSDALSLARACGNFDLAYARGLYRSNLHLSPYSASLISSLSPPDIFFLCSLVFRLSLDSDFLIVESAGGLLSPLGRYQTMADFASLLSLPLLAVVRDCLGVISQTLSLFESSALRQLPISALVLVRHEPGDFDLSIGSNFSILSERLSCPVFAFPFCFDDDNLLSSASESCGLVDLFSPS